MPAFAAGMSAIWPGADCLLLGCFQAKRTLTLARQPAVSDPKRTLAGPAEASPQIRIKLEISRRSHYLGLKVETVSRTFLVDAAHGPDLVSQAGRDRRAESLPSLATDRRAH
jgi:hypothetical protein